MRSSVIKKSDNVLVGVYNSLSDNFKSKFVFDEFSLVYHLDSSFKSIVDSFINKEKDILSVEDYLLEKDKLPLFLLVNSYLIKYRNMKLDSFVSLVYYKRLFGSNNKSDSSLYDNYLSLLSKVIHGKKDFDKNLSDVLSIVRKRERDRVKYKKPEEYFDFSKSVISYLENLGGSVKAPEGSDSVSFIAEFILYDEELNVVKTNLNNDSGGVELVYSKLFKLLPYVVLYSEKEDVNEKVEKSNKADKANKSNKADKANAREVARLAKVKAREDALREKYKDKYLLESDENTLAFVTKLRKFNKLLISKGAYNLVDLELYKSLGKVLHRASESIQKKAGYGITVYEDESNFEYLAEFKIDSDVHLFFVTPYFIVNTKTRRVFADKTKMIKSLSRHKVTSFEKSFGAVIMVLMKLIGGRREKDRMSKDMKSSDIQRINRFSYIFSIRSVSDASQATDSNFYILRQTDANGNLSFGIFNKGVHTSTVSFEYDKKDKPYIRIRSRHNGNYIITPDFIVDMNTKSYLYKRESVSAPVSLLKDHFKSNRKLYSGLIKNDYISIMNSILRAWDLRRRLTGYSRGFNYVKIKSSSI